MTQRDWALIALPSDESEVERRYTTILRSLQALLPGHGALLDELDASVSELLAEADDRARLSGPDPVPATDLPLATGAKGANVRPEGIDMPTMSSRHPRPRRGGHR
jgi:hypothetical protein